jgi:hypothetical protein
VGADAPPGRVTLKAELTAQASGGERQTVGVLANGSLQVKPAPPKPSPTPPTPAPSPTAPPAPTPGPELADTGVAEHRVMMGVVSMLAVAGGSGALLWARRRRA